MSCETLQQILQRQVDKRPQAPALVCGDRVTSFRALQAHSQRAARALMSAGAGPGARIGYLGKNSDRFFELLFAAASAGAVLVPIGWRLTAPEIAFLIADAELELLFIHPEFGQIGEALTTAHAPALISTEAAHGTAPAYVDWLADAAASQVPFPQSDADQPVLQLYTSGTTGRPKGAMLSHANLFALRSPSAPGRPDWDSWHESDVSLVTMPVAHISGTVWGLIGIYHGVKSIILPEFDAGAMLRIVSTAPISKIFLVPTALQAVLRHPDSKHADFSRLRHILYGGSPIPLDLLREAISVFGCGFVQIYGMTETSGSIAALSPEDHDPSGNARMRSAGRALPGVEIRIADEDLQPLGPGRIGEILVRSPKTMLGYWGRPQATQEAIVDGWMRTGDAGYLDADGYLFVQDRMQDMIITGGENVYPAEVERALLEHPGIADVAIIGVPDARWGEAVTAIVVRADGMVNERELLLWARARLASYKVPKQVRFQDHLPRTASGKILRRILRDEFSPEACFRRSGIERDF